MKTLMQTDTQLFHWLFNLTAKRDCRWIIWLSRTGDGHLYLLLGLCLWIFETQHGALFLYSALLAYSLELPVYLVLKNFLKRTRPCDLFHNFNPHIRPSDKFSLPSGHTAAAFLMASLISTFYPSTLLFVYLWASIVGLSRVLLGVHYPSDIIAGATLGMGMSYFSLALL